MALEVTPTSPGVYIDEVKSLSSDLGENLHEVPMEDPSVVPIPHVGGPVQGIDPPRVIVEGDSPDEFRLKLDRDDSRDEEG